MSQDPIPYVGVGEQRLLSQMATVLDPFTTRHAGQPVSVIKVLLGRVWREEFDARLPQPTLTRCAQAIAGGRDWRQAMRSDDYSHPPITPQPKPDPLQRRRLASPSRGPGARVQGITPQPRIPQDSFIRDR